LRILPKASIAFGVMCSPRGGRPIGVLVVGICGS